MAVFYEFSNVIEIYIQDKPSCPTWNDGNAALGIQNNDGDLPMCHREEILPILLGQLIMKHGDFLQLVIKPMYSNG